MGPVPFPKSGEDRCSEEQTTLDLDIPLISLAVQIEWLTRSIALKDPRENTRVRTEGKLYQDRVTSKNRAHIGFWA